MPAGDIKVLEQAIDAISKETDRFVILSTHDDVDIVIPKEKKTINNRFINKIWI